MALVFQYLNSTVQEGRRGLPIQYFLGLIKGLYGYGAHPIRRILFPSELNPGFWIPGTTAHSEVRNQTLIGHFS